MPFFSLSLPAFFSQQTLFIRSTQAPSTSISTQTDHQPQKPAFPSDLPSKSSRPRLEQVPLDPLGPKHRANPNTTGKSLRTHWGQKVRRRIGSRRGSGWSPQRSSGCLHRRQGSQWLLLSSSYGPWPVDEPRFRAVNASWPISRSLSHLISTLVVRESQQW
jgi:hypothetical protein